jgi:hypothetical protein
MEGSFSDYALRLRSGYTLRLRSGYTFGSAQGTHSAPLRAGKIRSLSGAEAPDFRDMQYAKFLRPSTPLRARKIRSLSGAEAPDFLRRALNFGCSMLNFCALRLRSGSKNLRLRLRAGYTFGSAQGRENPVAERSRSAGFSGAVC